jgi:lambda family phage portal protein
MGPVTKVLAKDVIHGFQTLKARPAPGHLFLCHRALLANDLRDYIDATVDTAKLAAKWLAIIETPDPLSRQLGSTLPPGFQHILPKNEAQKIEFLENCIIEYLRPGEKITLSQNPNPGANFAPFVKLILCMVSIIDGIPYELLSGNYEGLNYSVSRAKRNDFAFELRPLAVRHVRHFCMPTFRSFLDSAVLTGKLPFPTYFTNPVPFARCEWQPPGMESIDPAREVKSLIDQMKAGLRSPQEIATSRGRDLEDIYREIKAARELAGEYGLNFDDPDVSTALKNNPAALEEQDEGTGEGDRTGDLRALLFDLMDRLDELSGRLP